jgi:hypothetical protein
LPLSALDVSLFVKRVEDLSIFFDQIVDLLFKRATLGLVAAVSVSPG